MKMELFEAGDLATIRSPGISGPTPAGVPVKIRSPGRSSYCIDKLAMISGTFQISSMRSPRCFSTPLTFSVIAPRSG